MDSFAKAVTKILKRFVDRGIESVEIYEVWIESSIPIDLIRELIETDAIEFPENLKEITYKGEVIWRRGVE